MHRDHDPDTLPTPTYDLVTERLLRARTIILSGEITQKLAAGVSAQLLSLAAESEADITVFLNSQGGHVEAGDTIHDILRFIAPRVRMIGTGWVASAGAHIYVRVPKEHRFCLPEHPVPAAPAGRRRRRHRLATSTSRRGRSCACATGSTGSSPRETGQPLERIEEDTQRNFWLGAEAAVRYGLVGRIIDHAADMDA